MNEILGYMLAGALGAIVRDVVSDGTLRIPYLEDGVLVLGFVGGALIGAFVGWVIDGDFLTATMAGYVGVSAIGSLLPRKADDRSKKEG